ncbi:MAG: hypothetical protein SPJ13_02220 [Bacteroidales bacterium]|nr:hypothetical protein [Bacteroidales bacterium]
MSKKIKIESPKYWLHHHYWANEELRVPVSRHYFLSTFGVRQRHDASFSESGDYVCTGVPGTGFFVRNTDSHSYHKFVRAQKETYKNGFWKMLAGKEPSYKRELKRVKKELAKETDTQRIHLLERYQNCLEIGKQAELLQRLQQGVKDKEGHRLRKIATGLITRMKGQLATLQHDMLAAEIKPLEKASEEQRTAWNGLLKAFASLMESRRLFSIEKNPKTGQRSYEQVFADKGIFRFIWMQGDTPLIRDAKGYTYYFYPQGIIRAASNLHFDLFHYGTLSVNYQPIDLNTLSEGNGMVFDEKNLRHRRNTAKGAATSTLYGISSNGKMAQISIPEMDLDILCSNPLNAQNFVDALGEVMKQADTNKLG